MHSSSNIISHVINGTCEVFILNPISIITLYAHDFANLTKLELIASSQFDVTLLKLSTIQNIFNLNTNISSNANLALVTNAQGLIIGDGSRIEAEKLLITNYLIDEQHFSETKTISMTPRPGNYYIKNQGNIFARTQKNSGLASNKFINKGSISDNIDIKSYMSLKHGQLVLSGVNEDHPTGSLLSGLFNFIFGNDHD
jgi:hypothetical protein